METAEIRFEDMSSTPEEAIGDVQVLSDDPLQVTVDEQSGGVLRFEGDH
jgi:hypothetical protein